MSENEYEKYKEYYERAKERERSNRKKYNEAHSEEIKEYHRLYRERNKEVLKEKASMQVECGCGSVYAVRNKTRHYESKKHKEYEASKE